MSYGGKSSRSTARDAPYSKGPRRSTRSHGSASSYIRKLCGFFSAPDYTANDAHAHSGGKKSVAILAPNGFTSGGTDADSKKPGAIVKAKTAFGIEFKAGHLLNADFGGSGSDPKNLTILTPTANRNHQSFDNPVKRAGTLLKELYGHLWKVHGSELEEMEFKMGIKVTVEVTGDAWGSDYPANCIFDELTCSAAVWYSAGSSALTSFLLPDCGPGSAVHSCLNKINHQLKTANENATVDNSNSG